MWKCAGSVNSVQTNPSSSRVRVEQAALDDVMAFENPMAIAGAVPRRTPDLASRAASLDRLGPDRRLLAWDGRGVQRRLLSQPQWR